jgi:hypothetical protein
MIHEKIKSIWFVGILAMICVLNGCKNVDFSSKLRTTNVSHHFETNIERFAHYASLLDIASQPKENAKNELGNLGYNTTYFAPVDRIIEAYPRVYILSNSEENGILILFLGTRSLFEWIQNLKAINYEDIAVSDTYFIPSGHAGFRRAIMNLVNAKFENAIYSHSEEYMLDKNDLKLTVLGYSQGAGIAQLSLPYLDGYKYKIENNLTYIVDTAPNISIEELVTFAPPYAISTYDKSWEIVNSCYGGKTYQIIRDNDFVSSAYNVSNNGRLSVMHFGQLVRITRDGVVKEEQTNWGRGDSKNDFPHSIHQYQRALTNRIERDSGPHMIDCKSSIEMKY